MPLTTLNLNHFKMVKAMGLKISALRSPSRHYLHTKFHENLPSSSKVISVGHTDRQTGDLISLLPFLESRLKMWST
jgi:hypothetical protein